jgi:uncharacterized iron-regulated membrane protein
MTFGMVGTAVVLLGGLAAVLWIGRSRRQTGRDGSLRPGFHPTSEVRVDPTSGRRLRVFVNPTTGERQYRDDPEDSR